MADVEILRVKVAHLEAAIAVKDAALRGENEQLLEVGRKAIEDLLIEFRDQRMSEFRRGNGLVIREKDGTDSPVIRFGPETALRVGMKAIAAALSPDAGAGCEHNWVDARNEYVMSGELCLKCGAVRAALNALGGT